MDLFAKKKVVLSVTQEITRRASELVAGSESFNIKMLPFFLSSLGCCFSKPELLEFIRKISRKKYTKPNILPCVILCKIISKKIKRRQFEPPSQAEIKQVVEKLDVDGTKVIAWEELKTFLEEKMPYFTPDELEEIRFRITDQRNHVKLGCLYSLMTPPFDDFSIYKYMDELGDAHKDEEEEEEEEDFSSDSIDENENDEAEAIEENEQNK